ADDQRSLERPVVLAGLDEERDLGVSADGGDLFALQARVHDDLAVYPGEPHREREWRVSVARHAENPARCGGQVAIELLAAQLDTHYASPPQGPLRPR